MNRWNENEVVKSPAGEARCGLNRLDDAFPS